MHTYCRLFVHIKSSCADFMHTDSVLCRLFADFEHILRRENVFHSYAAPRPAGPGGSPLPNRGGGAMAAAPGSYACLGEAAVAVAGPALLGEAAGPPPPATLPGEGGGVAAAAFKDRDEAEAAAAAAAFEGEAAEAVAAAGGTAAAAAAGRGGPIILAIESIAPALEDCFLPPAIFAYRLVTSSA
jgi:hypothetical protein